MSNYSTEPNRGGTNNRSGNNNGTSTSFSDKEQREREQKVADALNVAETWDGSGYEGSPGQARDAVRRSGWREPAGGADPADCDVPVAWFVLTEAARQDIRDGWVQFDRNAVYQKAQGAPQLSPELDRWLNEQGRGIDPAALRARRNRNGQVTTLDGLFVGADQAQITRILGERGVPSALAAALLEQVPQSRTLLLKGQHNYEPEVNHALLQGATDEQKMKLSKGDLPDTDRIMLAQDPNVEVRLALAACYRLNSAEVNEILIKDADPSVRQLLARYGIGEAAFAERLADDPDPDVRYEVMSKGLASVDTQVRLVGDKEWKVRVGALSGHSPVEVQRAVAKHRDWKTRIGLTLIGGADKDVLKKLTRDWNPLVALSARAAIKKNAEYDAVLNNEPGAREEMQRKLDLERAKEQVRRLR